MFLLVASTFLAAAQQPATAWEAKIKYFVTCKGIDNSKRPPVPVGVTDSFSTTDETVHILLHLENVKGPIKVTFKVFDPGGELFGQRDFGWDKGDYKWIVYPASINVANIKDRPGEWTVEAYADGQLLQTLKFMLSPPGPPPVPKLEVLSLTQTPAEGEPLYLGGTLTIKLKLRNSGGALAEGVLLTFEDITPAEGLAVVKASPAKNLAPNEDGEWILEVKANKPGKYAAVMRLYLAGEKVDELPWTIVVSPPKLVIVDATQTPAKGEPFYVGDTATLKYFLKNEGEAVARSVEIDVELPEGLKLVEATAAKDLPPGAVGEWTVKIKAEKEGEYEAAVALYSMGVKIDEGTLPVTVSSRPVSNLTLIAGILGIVAAVAVVVALVRRRGKPAPAEAPPPPAPREVKRFCANCGAEVPADATYCPNCGAPQ